MSQPYPLREQLKALEHLQELDLKIDRLKKDKAALPLVLKTLDDSINKVRLGLEAKKATLADIEKGQRQTQAALDLNRDRLTRSNGKLEGVQNSHEFQAANKELEQLKKLMGTLEEQNKKSATESENVTKELAETSTQQDKLKEEREAKAAELSGLGDRLDKEISSLDGERKAFTTKVETRILSQYERVRPARGGLGIVPAVGGRCKGCNMMVPPQLFNEIQRGSQIHQCPSCHRILFVPGTNDAESAELK